MSNKQKITIGMPIEEILEDAGIDMVGHKELILHNDDTNSFEWAVTSIIQVCSHSLQVAMALATQAHQTGTAALLEGKETELAELAKEFKTRGFNATVE